MELITQHLDELFKFAPGDKVDVVFPAFSKDKRQTEIKQCVIYKRSLQQDERRIYLTYFVFYHKKVPALQVNHGRILGFSSQASKNFGEDAL